MSRHVLIVDDDSGIRALFGDIVEREGFSPLFAASGAEAIATLRERHGRVALILLDVEMPGIDGFGFRRLQMLTPAIADIPTIVISAAHLDTADRARLGATTYLPKPSGTHEIRLAIRNHVRSV